VVPFVAEPRSNAQQVAPEEAKVEQEECLPPFGPSTSWSGRYTQILTMGTVPPTVGSAAAGESFVVQLLISDCPDGSTDDCRGAIDLEIVDGKGGVVAHARNEDVVPNLSNRLPGPKVILPAGLDAGCYVARVWYSAAGGGPPLLIERGIRIVRRTDP
jgi:hypothetical protein